MSIILNKTELAENPLRDNALTILEAGYEAIQTEKILKNKISVADGIVSVDGKEFELKNFERVLFVGIGKCALDGARVLEEMLGGYLFDGIALDVKPGDLRKIRSYVGTHPYPSEQNVLATKQILEMIKNVTEKDLVITLISGGGSALFDLPILDVVAMAQITETLTVKGADIFELNTVRKHLSQIKGGGFAKLLYPAQVISLIFSDVLGNDISMVASGPTVLDTTSVSDAESILKKYEIPDCPLTETPKDQKYFEKTKNILIVSNADALEAMEEKARELGFETAIETDRLSGDAEEIGRQFAARMPVAKTCVLLGGETTVKIPANHGSGGRNQTMALSALLHLQEGTVLICASSDGWDNTEHAGAVVDVALLEKAKNFNLNPAEFLARSDSFNFFKKVSGGIYTGKLGSNVSDLYIILYK